DSVGSCTDGIGICFLYLKERAQSITGLALKTMGTADCGTSKDIECRDKEAALHLKTIAIFLILIASAAGVAFPLFGRRLNFIRTNGNFFVIAKAFAAGVILATGFVHMLSDAEKALTDDCLPDMPWSKFPFSGFFAMLAALCTLLADFVGTQYYERKHLKEQEQNGITTGDHNEVQHTWPELITAPSVEDGNEKKPEDEHGDRHMHIVGMRAHAASHSHSHPHGHHSCEDETHEHVHKQFGHTHTEPIVYEPSQNIRHLVVSQVLELGIVSHSVIVGLSLGVSQSPCTIRPLMAALCFHQFFEGFALGGCISQ
ncbi:hypothetical protein KI387_026099, partial [Taxus chinensis]